MRPSALDRLPETARVYLDVRGDLRAGREPCARIMAAVDALRPDGVCPFHEAMEDWVRRAVLAVPGVGHVDVPLAFDPPWTPARIAVSRARALTPAIRRARTCYSARGRRRS